MRPPECFNVKVPILYIFRFVNQFPTVRILSIYIIDIKQYINLFGEGFRIFNYPKHFS